MYKLIYTYVFMCSYDLNAVLNEVATPLYSSFSHLCKIYMFINKVALMGSNMLEKLVIFYKYCQLRRYTF